MHDFQPYPLELYEGNPFTLISDSFVITTTNGDKVNTMTASWGELGHLWNKDVLTVFVRNSRYTKELLDMDDYFSITCFDTNTFRAALKYLGMVSGREEDKIAAAHLTVNTKYEVPFIDEGNFSLICKKVFAQELSPDCILDPAIREQFYKDGDYHVMYVGEVVQALAR